MGASLRLPILSSVNPFVKTYQKYDCCFTASIILDYELHWSILSEVLLCNFDQLKLLILNGIGGQITFLVRVVFGMLQFIDITTNRK